MLKSNFIKPKLSIDFFGKTRFWAGLFLGLCGAFLLYAFFSFFKLAILVSTSMERVAYSITPPEETLFYQFIFAFVALLMGQHIFFEFALSKPRKFLEREIRKKTILHNSRFVSWFTFFVGFKWVVSIGLLSFIQLTPFYGFFTVGWWVSILLIIWWHFFTWAEVSKVFKNGRKWSLISFLGISFLSLIFIQKFSNLYSGIYEQSVKQLPHYKLKLDLPDADGNTLTQLKYQSLTQTFFVGDPKETDTIKISTPWYGEIEIHSLPLSVEDFNQKIPESKRSLIVASLIIDKETKMKHVYKILKKLGENHRNKIAFTTLSPEQKQSNLYFKYFDNALLTYTPPQCNYLKPAIEIIQKNPKTTPQDLENFYSKTEYPYCEFYFGFSEKDFKTNHYFIKLSAQNKFSFNGEKIVHKELFEKIKTVIEEKKENAVFVFDVNDNATYEHYFFLRHEHRRAMKELRNQEAMIHFGRKYELLDKVKRKEIKSKYPILMWEFFSTEEKFIFNFFLKKSSEN